jgi:transposase-like protein
MHQTRQHARAALAERIEQLAAAVDAYRSDQPRRRLSHALRVQVVAAVDAGATVRAVSAACKLSKSQITRWRQTAAHSGKRALPSSAPVMESPRVLSVVDSKAVKAPRLDGEIELRIGGWLVSLHRVAD